MKWCLKCLTWRKTTMWTRVVLTKNNEVLPRGERVYFFVVIFIVLFLHTKYKESFCTPLKNVLTLTGVEKKKLFHRDNFKGDQPFKSRSCQLPNIFSLLKTIILRYKHIYTANSIGKWHKNMFLQKIVYLFHVLQ